ncbi:EcsC family protein [Wenzhouxiangella sp. XN79A]|uniref:EcsC family protein n=1 Tax=Wenzhouxiangella sp. XN79A TaxID=2724193 RepID=UPI00144A588A|nr:EcsC family protein [Wenzhouxiangella sp. XN79A]NKI36323.1 EcsC family protein [Wenzhouxiangella sp. XN79A]
MTLTTTHLDELKQARLLLEDPSITARLTDALASPIESGMKYLPAGARDQIVSISDAALRAALRVALSTLAAKPAPPSNRLHKAGGALSGALGGAFGLPALAVELPISTSIMLRSIADVARSQGEDLARPESQLACMEVFALGGRTESDNAAESGYFAVRAALAKAVSDAVRYAATAGTVNQAAPALVRLIARIATRFSIPVTQKAAAQALPAVGAAGGAIINVLFLDHFQDMAHGHFVVRRLERIYGPSVVQEAYRAIDEHPTP